MFAVPLPYGMAIETVKQRNALAVRREPYWHLIATGRHLGFRKTDDGGHWIARSYDAATRKRHYRALGDFRTRPDNERFNLASKQAREWFDHLDAGGTTELVTVADACRHYVRKAKTTDAALDAERRFARYVYDDPIASVALTKLRQTHVEAWRERLAASPARQPKRGAKCRVKTPQPAPRPRSLASVNRDMVPMRAALYLAKSKGSVTSDAAWASALAPIANANGRRTLYIERRALRAFIAALPQDAAAFVSALAQLPIRPGALAALQVQHFSKTEGKLTIVKDKAGAGRNVPLPHHILPLFVAQTKWKLPGAPLFARANGKPWSKDDWKKPIAEAARTANLPGLTAYTLRHCAITDLVTARHPLLSIAQMAGTSVQMIQKHYGHLIEDDARKALATLAL
jgi:integrase